MENKANQKRQEKKREAKEKVSHMEVYTIIRSDSNDKGLFIRCGGGFRNERDGSLNILLNHLPVSSELHVRAPKDQTPCWKALPQGSYRVFELPSKENQKWAEVGVACGNRDESLNIRLNLYPNNRRLNIRLRLPPSEA